MTAGPSRTRGQAQKRAGSAAPTSLTAPSDLSARVRTVALATVGGAISVWLVGRAVQSVAGDRNAPWMIGRASGVSCYLLLVALVAVGLGLSHPWRGRLRTPSNVTRIRIHLSLAAFALALLVLHVVVLATDSYAKVGWSGAFLPMASEYRPVPITLGVLGAYSGLFAGVTAVSAGRWARRIWYPVHKLAIGVLGLVWLHALLAGSDAKGLMLMYVLTGLGIVVLAASRYLTPAPHGLISGVDSRYPRQEAR